jgi:hypothetical protein
MAGFPEEGTFQNGRISNDMKRGATVWGAV